LANRLQGFTLFMPVDNMDLEYVTH
jgi:hypothetical protein